MGQWVSPTPPVINISVYFIHLHKAQMHRYLWQAAVIHFTSEEDALLYTVNCNAMGTIRRVSFIYYYYYSF